MSAIIPVWKVLQDASQDAREFALIASNRGWVIHRTSCACGGQYAWFEPDGDGVETCRGCICHRKLAELITPVTSSIRVPGENNFR